jgi:hypothetical protein
VNPIPDVPQTRLAFRVWRVHKPSLTLLSLNAPQGRASWVTRALASPRGGWPHDGGPEGTPAPLVGRCERGPGPGSEHEHEHEHGPVPSKRCTCGIYATTQFKIIDGYLSDLAPVLGVVELGGRVIPAAQGYRAQCARIAAILLIEPALTLPHPLLRQIAETYQVPALVPHSMHPEDYRNRLAPERSLADEVERYLRSTTQEGN